MSLSKCADGRRLLTAVHSSSKRTYTGLITWGLPGALTPRTRQFFHTVPPLLVAPPTFPETVGSRQFRRSHRVHLLGSKKALQSPSLLGNRSSLTTSLINETTALLDPTSWWSGSRNLSSSGFVSSRRRCLMKSSK